MAQLLLGVDVGGTNTRVRSMKLEGSPQSEDITTNWTRKVNSKPDLESFLRNVLAEISVTGHVASCAMGFAGPVLQGAHVTMTNWSGDRTITLIDLYSWGLPERNCVIMNDMEATALGIMQLSPTESKHLVALYRPNISKQCYSERSNKIVLAPGTGLGTVTIVSANNASRQPYIECVPSEIQHFDAAPVNQRHEDVIKWIQKQKLENEWPRWEDFISGYGLVNTYRGLRELDGLSTSHDLVGEFGPHENHAAEIAKRANANDPNNPHCIEALDIFYRCVGRVAQLMALVTQPYSGIYLYGASTRHNLDFIKRSDLVDEAQRNRIQSALLRQFPIYAFTDEINLDGCLWACRKLLEV